MSQTRIVLDPAIRQIVDQIQAKTRANSPSAAIALMISRYGRHLLETWELEPMKCSDSNTAQSFTAPVEQQVPNFSFSDPIEGI
jgi:hypothetical protein